MLLNTVSCFEKATGAVVQYSGSRDFAALVVADLRSNNAPNIAIFPQPGLAADMAKEGHLVPRIRRSSHATKWLTPLVRVITLVCGLE